MTGAVPAIYRATRPNANAAFGTPEPVTAITGFVEAPSLSRDGKALFYHKQVNGVFRVYKVAR